MDVQRVYSNFLLFMRTQGMCRVPQPNRATAKAEVARMLDLNNNVQEKEFAALAREMQQRDCRGFYVERFRFWCGSDGVLEVRLTVE